MAPWLVFSGLFVLCAVGIIGLFAQSSGQKTALSTSLLAAFAMWGGAYWFVFSQSPEPLHIGLWAHALLLCALHVFCFRLSSRHINIHAALPWMGGISITAMCALSIPRASTLIQELYAFAGVISTLGLLLYCERLSLVFKANGQLGTRMVLSLGLIAGALFINFCDMMVHPKLTASQPQWLGILFVITFPFMYQGLLSLLQLQKKLKVSRPLAFHTTLFTIAGFYLLGLSGAGAVAQMYGLTYTSTVTLTGGMAIPLLYLMFSGRLRRNLLVWINKHFFADQFDYRQTWRQLTQSLSPELDGQQACTSGLAAIQQSIHHEGGSLYRRKSTTESWRLAASTRDTESVVAEQAVVGMADRILSRNWIIDVEEWQQNPELYSPLPECPEALRGSDIHWIVPLTQQHGQALWLISGGSKPRWPLNWETRDFLVSLLSHLEGYLHTQDSRRQIYENAQLAAFHQTSAFVVHDLKNVFAQLSLVNHNAAVHKNNPAFIEDMLLTLAEMQGRMDKMLTQLSAKQNPQHSRVEHLSISGWWTQMQHDLPSMLKYGVTPVIHPLTGAEDVYANVDKERLTNVFKHLLDNAMYATQKKSSPSISVTCNVFLDTKYVTICIEDNGVGMTEEFLKTKLYKPFETTKGNSGIGLGVYDAKQFAEQVGGTLEFRSQFGQGTQVFLSLPRSGIACVY